MKRVSCAWSFVLLATVASTAQVQFKTSTSIVRLDVTVTDRSGSVRGLAAEDFRIEDSGERPLIRVDELVDVPLDVVLVAPPISSVFYVAADQVNTFAAGVTAFLDQFRERDRVAVVLAAAPPRPLRSLQPGRPEFGLDAFDVGTEFYAAPFDGIALGLRMFEPSNRREVLVAFTNGADFRSLIDVDAMEELIGRLGPAVVLVGTSVTIEQRIGASGQSRDGRPLGSEVAAIVSGSVLPARLDRLAGRAGRVINLAADNPRLVMERLVTSLRSGYVLSYEAPATKGWHPVKVSVNRRGVTVTSRQGYFIE